MSLLDGFTRYPTPTRIIDAIFRKINEKKTKKTKHPPKKNKTKGNLLMLHKKFSFLTANHYHSIF